MSILQIIEFSAVVTSAIYGALIAHRKGMDFVGLFSLGFVVAFGGGTLRDLFLDRHPLFWIANGHYPVIVFFLTLAGSVLPGLLTRIEKHLAFPDALGTGLFTIVGTGYALDSGTSWFVASLIGVLTGTFGGVMADVISNELPSMFRPAPLQATCAFTGAWCYILGMQLPMSEIWALPVSVLVVVLMRLAALKWNLQLPSANREHGGGEL